MENSTDAVATYTVSGTMADTAIWTREGDDAEYFTLTDGVLKFRSAPDYESPMGGANDDSNTYMVTVKAEAGGEMEMREVTVEVTNEDELGTLEGDDSLSHTENGTDVGTYTVSGGDGSTPVTWTREGPDAESFRLDGTGMSRMLKFSSAPDYESPMGGANDDSNTYMVTVKAEAGGEMEMMEVTIMVTNEEEDGTVTLDPTRPSVGTEITATLADLDIVKEDTVSWQWASADAMGGTFENITGANSASYTPDAGDTGMYLRATATYEDGYDDVNSEMMVTETAVSQLVVNGPDAVSYEEGGTSAVGTYTASGASGANASWTVSGDDAGAFNISGGQLTFVASPDFEAPADDNGDNVYMVTVVATATTGTLMASQEVTVTVVNEDEDGTVTLDPMRSQR